MKQLLIKEFRLTSCPLTFFFLAFTLTAMIPGYPILVGAFFVCLGIFYTFQFAREYNDVLYTALLPVAKSDVVKARYSFVITVEMMAFFLSTILTFIRMTMLSTAKPYVENLLMNANLVYLGSYLVILALFNLIFVTGFFKTAYYFGKAFIYFIIAAFIVIGIMETLHHIPGLEALNSSGFDAIGVQLGVLTLGIVIYVTATVFSLRKSISQFELIDL